METIQNYINGKSRDAIGGAWLDVHEPATGEVYARLADSDARDVDVAVRAAHDAFGAWSTMSGAQRGALLNRVADLIESNLEELAQAESIDTGKPIALARSVDIPRAAANLRFFAAAARQDLSKTFKMDGSGGGKGGGVSSQSAGDAGAMNYVERQPRGVAGCISPWNLPLYLLTWKIAPALATGNTVVAKPSEVTPMTAAMLCTLFTQAGVPPGVFNIVHGVGAKAGGAIVTHPDVPTVTFTGSTAVGKWIAKETGPMFKRVSLELGGKNPFVVFDDVDLEHVVEQAARAGFANQGQICLCGSRMIVHESIYDDFVAGLSNRVEQLKMGDPLDESTQHGAQVSREHLAKIESFVNKARDLGGTIHTGGERPKPDDLPARCADGAFYRPTIITGLENSCEVIQEEIFGPVITVQSFRTEQQAIELANSTKYGLAGTVWTKDQDKARRVAGAIDCGIMWINCWLVRDLRTPFGGMKQSGVGREGGEEALRFFTESKNVCVKL